MWSICSVLRKICICDGTFVVAEKPLDRLHLLSDAVFRESETNHEQGARRANGSLMSFALVVEVSRLLTLLSGDSEGVIPLS